MKVFLVKGKYVEKFNLTALKKFFNENRRKKVGIIYPIQFEEIAKKIRNAFRNNIFYFGQIVGCNPGMALNSKVDIFLYVGDGIFHPLSFIKEQIERAILKNKTFRVLDFIKPVYTFNLKTIKKFPEEKINEQIKAIKVRWVNFVSAKKIGIISSIKPGQENIKLALSIRDRLKKLRKEAYLFLTNEINTNEFYNFPIDFWIITACQQFAINSEIEWHKKICNLREFKIFLSFLEKEKR